MDDTAIKVDSVSKSFKLPHEKAGSVKNLFTGMFRGKRSYEKQEVLKDVSFEIKKGEFFGIVGRNGSGKSTLLKLMAGIYSPGKGAITVNGKLTPFIELGVGFNPELTGRENVFLNGALLGFNRKDMEAMYDEIVEFAELEKFMDQKLKNYSSGMQVRLAFSIAIRAKSDILLLDEVLAVGDAAFQKKCIDIFERYKAEKQTVVLVTHDMETVRRFCSRAMLISNGDIVEVGEPNLIATKYARINRESKSESTHRRDTKIKIKIDGGPSQGDHNFNIGDELVIDASWPVAIGGVMNVGLAIIKQSGEFIFGTNTIEETIKPKNNKISYRVKLDIGPGSYYIMCGLFGKTKYDVIEFLDKGPGFIIEENLEDAQHGFARLDHKWENK